MVLEPFDLCGLGTEHGCGRVVGAGGHIVLDARTPMAEGGRNEDNGHVMFHARCLPSPLAPHGLTAVWPTEHIPFTAAPAPASPERSAVPASAAVPGGASGAAGTFGEVRPGRSDTDDGRRK